MSPDGVKRRLSAILNADVVGYSKLMEADEESTVRTLESYRKTVFSLIENHSGKVIDSPGDNLLAEFASVVDAVQCAVEIQHVLKAKNAVVPEARRMQFRIGISLEDVIEEDGRIYGDGVNIAARIEGLADAGGICISGRAYDHIANKLALGYEDIGEHKVKHISAPVKVFSIPIDAADGSAGKAKKTPRRLQWMAVVALVAFLAGIGAVTLLNQTQKTQKAPESVEEESSVPAAQEAKPPNAEKPSIAVLPFDNMSGDPEQEYFVDGMVDEVITKLSMNRMLTVIARNSTFFYKDKAINTKQIAEELGVRYVVEGSVRKVGDTIRATIQLIEAATTSHIWAETYEGEMKDVFALQDNIALQIVAALNVKYQDAELKRLKRRPTDSLTAYELFLRGSIYRYRIDYEIVLEARAYLHKAIELDPDYADAIGALADTYWGAYYHQFEGLDALEKGAKLANEAVILDDSSYSAHWSLAAIHVIRGEFERASIGYKKLIELNPNDADSYMGMGFCLAIVEERHEEGIMQMKKAILLNPHLPAFYLNNLGWAYRLAGRYPEAIVTQKEALTFDPSFYYTHKELAITHIENNQGREARSAAEELMRLNPSFSVEAYGKRAGYKNRAQAERDMAALRKAGLK